jgi:hypothetical protein
MSCRVSLLFLVALVGAACSDQGPVPASVAGSTAAATTPAAARERLAQALAVALNDPATRRAVKARLDGSNAPEGKVQFQAFVQSNQATLLAALARASATTVGELLSDLDAARGLELYLPVPAQRAAWTGDASILVATIGSEREAPVGFDLTGARRVLDRATPPAEPVLALVPQETDFTRGHAERVMACVDMCGDGTPGYGGGNPSDGGNPAPGLYLVQSHFNDYFESWVKGAPEFEYHVYGLGDNGQSVQLACTGESQAGQYQWDQNALDWTGSVMLLSDADYNAYQARHPGAPIRIVAWEDDDEACVDRADVNNVSALITAVDNAYKAITSGKVDPWYIHGIKAAPSIFSIISAVHNIILTNDDMIGNAVEATITGDAPSGANWVLKSNGTTTMGWLTTRRLP